MRHKPCRLLADAQFVVQAHGANALEADRFKVDRVGPVYELDLGICHDRANAEVLN